MIEYETSVFKDKLKKLVIASKGSNILYFDHDVMTINSFDLRVDVDFECETPFVTVFNDLYSYISKLKTSKFTMEPKGDHLIIKADRRKTIINLLKLDVDTFPEKLEIDKSENISLVEQFDGMIKLFKSVNRKDATDLISQTVFFQDNKAMFSDKAIIVIKEFDISFETDFAMKLDNLKKLKNYSISSIQLNNERLQCSFEDGTITFGTINYSKTPPFNDAIKRLVDLKRYNFPMEFYNDIGEFATVLKTFEGISCVEFKVGSDCTIVTSSNHAGTVEIKYEVNNEYECEFFIDLKYLPPEYIMNDAVIEIVPANNTHVLKVYNEAEKTTMVVMGRLTQ